MEKKTYPSGVITPELGSTNWYSDYDTNSSLLDSNITKTNSLDSKVKELETSYTNVETSLTSLSAVAKSGDYNDLSNKPESIALAEKAVADGDNNVITKTYATKKEVVTSLEPYIKKTELADVATSGSYTDLSDKPTTIAHADRATADNNGDVITVTYAKKTEIPNLDGYALSKDISKVGKTNNYKDLDNLPTIPSLDGYVTNVELSPVAKSGDYNDLSNTPEPVDLTPYATKKELSSKADDDNVVHKSGNETVNGAKLFTVAPLSANSDTTNGFFIRNNAIARNEVPSQFYHSAFRVYDKRDHIFGEYCVEKSTSGFSLLNMNVRSETADGTEISRGLFLTLGNDGSVVAFRPSTDNEFSLGISSFKWKDVNTTLLNGKTPAYAYNTTMITGAMHVGSVLTNGGKVVSFVVPINLNGSPTIAFTRLRLRYNGNYLFGSAGNSDVTTSYTFTTTVFNGGLIVTINFSDTDQNAINNSCIVAEIILKLTY